MQAVHLFRAWDLAAPARGGVMQPVDLLIQQPAGAAKLAGELLDRLPVGVAQAGRGAPGSRPPLNHRRREAAETSPEAQ